MKSVCRILSLLFVFVLLGSLCACGVTVTISTPTGRREQKKVGATYSATYDLNYDGQKLNVTYVSDDGYTPQTPTRPGYQFLYWEDSNGAPTDGVIPAKNTGTVNFVAVWQIVTYRVIYENLTDEECASLPKTFTVEDTVAVPDPARTGYRFLGWNSGLETGLTSPAGQTGDCVLRANWVLQNLRFSASSNVADIPVSASYSDQTLKIGTVVHASAPVYRDDYRFVRWEVNGTPVCTSAVYTFPLSRVVTELTAVYEQQTFVEYTKRNADLTVSDILSKKPGLILGGGVQSGDYSLTDTGVTLKASYLATLEPGDYSFYVAALSGKGEIGESRTFMLRISGTEIEKPGYEDLPEAGKYYLYKTVSYQGEQIPLVASTNEEFRRLVEYSVLVGGVLELQAAGKTTGKYELEVYVWGDLNKRLQNKEKILEDAIRSVSFPMTPKISISYYEDSVGSETTIIVSYDSGMNAFTSSQTATAMADKQGLLTSEGRGEDFEAFPIDSLTETALVQTLYELEVLPYGKKPVFASTAAQAQEIYEIARGILRKIVDNGMTDYEKATAIYNWIALNLTYDKVTASNPSGMSSSAYTLKGALIDHLAVCDGYASAFRLLCQIEGIRCEEVIGLKQISDASTGHAWNKVWIGGAVFGVDCTWARQKVGDGEIVTSSYLFLDEIGLILCEHYENASSGEFWVQDLANASILLPAAVAIDAQNHSLVIRNQIDLNAMIAYLKSSGIKSAEFYLADGAPTVYSSSEYTAYKSEDGKYGYIFFK